LQEFQGVKHFVITLLHPSRGRAFKAKQTLDFWISQSSGKISIEHILSIDCDDPQKDAYKTTFKVGEITKSILVTDNSCVVEATNRAAFVSKGDILIYLSDDFKCPKDWDLLIMQKFYFEVPMLLKVDDCLQPFNADVLTIPMMNRKLYGYLGYFWNPLYKSQFVDQDLYWVCSNSNWINFAKELKFPHEHYVNKKADHDETYKRSQANWNQGKEVYHRRKQEGFK